MISPPGAQIKPGYATENKLISAGVHQMCYAD